MTKILEKSLTIIRLSNPASSIFKRIQLNDA